MKIAAYGRMKLAQLHEESSGEEQAESPEDDVAVDPGKDDKEESAFPYQDKEPLNVILHQRFFEVSVYQSTMMLLFGRIQRPLRYIVVENLRESKIYSVPCVD